MTHGVRQIVRFNWPMYVAVAIAAVLTLCAASVAPTPMRGALYLAIAIAVAWIGASLIVSWIVYDCSPLMGWNWIARAVPLRPDVWINIHAGLDASTPALRALFAGSRGCVFDIFDPGEMTEPSIARARRLSRHEVQAERVDFRHFPLPSRSVEAAFLLLSAHELRTDAARDSLFGEIQRMLAPSGRVVVAEHLRDLANFIAFGPGFLHFHARRTWFRAFVRSGFAVESEWSITPFVRVFLLRSAV